MNKDNEIEFRAFDDGKMIYESNILSISKEDNCIVRLAKFFSNIRSDSILMRFVNIRDKKNIKIFDRDIIKYTEHEEYFQKSFTAEIKWIDECACFGYKKIEKNELGLEDILIHPFSEHDEFQSDILPFIEVIGNVYEHKHLLKNK